MIICHYKGRFLQAIFHTSMSISIHVMTMMVEALLRRRREFCFKNILLSNRSNVLDNAPLLFTELYFTFNALLNSHQVFALVLCCWLVGTQAPHIARWNHGIIQTWYSYLLGDTAVFLLSKIYFRYIYVSKLHEVGIIVVVLQEQNFAFWYHGIIKLSDFIDEGHLFPLYQATFN